MRFGSPYASGYGSPDNMVKYLRFDRSRLAATGRIFLLFMMRSGWGGNNVYAGVYAANTLIANVLVRDGVEISLPLPELPFSTETKIEILRIGHYGDPGYSIGRVARVGEAREAAKVTAQWVWKARAVGADLDGGFTSNWVLNGCTRLNTNGILGQRSWGQLQLDIVVAAGVATVTLTNAGTVVASGSAAVAGVTFTVTLTAQNNSGMSGSVDLAPAVVSVANGVMYVKWPKSMNILRGAANPPTVVVGNVLYNGKDAGNWSEPTDLAPGNYYYELQAVSDDGIVGGATAAFLEVVNGPPLPPTNLAYQSGSAGFGITLSFTPSPTAGATYHAYLGTPNTQMNMASPVASAAAGANTIFIAAVALTGGAGLFMFAVRATSAAGGYEEKNIDIVLVNLKADGTVQPPSPNQPTIILNSISFSGRQVSVRVTYPTDDEIGPATQIQLFARNPLGAYVLSAPLVVANLTATSTGVKSATLVYTFPSDQIVFLAATALTAAGAQGPLSAEVGPFNPSTAANAPAPDNFKFTVSRT